MASPFTPSIRLHGQLFLTCGLALLCLLGTRARADSSVLTTAKQVHDLPSDKASAELRVHLIATVSYYEPAESTLFVEDSTGAVYVRTDQPYKLHRGDLVDIEGVTARSFRTTVGSNSTIRVLGKGSLKRTEIKSHQSYVDLMAGKWDCQYATLTGTVRSALVEKHNNSSVLELEIMTRGGLVQAFVQNHLDIDPGALVDAQVAITGIVGGNFNAQMQLMQSVIYVSSSHDIRIIKKPHVPRASLPLTSVDRVMQTYSVIDKSERVRVRGAVTYYRPGYSVVVQHQGRSLYAATRETKPLQLGSIVDLIGFAEAGSYSPALGQTEITPTQAHEDVSPESMTFAQGMTGIYSDNLVTIRGHIISQMRADTSDTILISVDNHPVTAVLIPHQSNEHLRTLASGTIVSITGICRITPGAVWGGLGTTPMFFRIDMRSSDDLKMIRSPSWWTVAHLFFALSTLLGCFIVISVWVVFLRRRVAYQTGRIERTIRLEKARSHILEAINSETALPKLLKEIQDSVERLIPDTYCLCSSADRERAAASHQDRREQDRREKGALPISIYQAALTDSKGHELGNFTAESANARTLSEYEVEVCSVHLGLANLAINQRRMYEELNYTSTHDQLTSLPNRRLFDLSLEHALEEASRTGVRLGVAYIDIDHFKQVNDGYGHKAGDLYLQQIASRLSSKVRATDKLARVGGDEFMLVAMDMKDLDDLECYKQRLESCFNLSFSLDGVRVVGSSSIGIALYPDHGCNAEELKRHADTAMYASKRRCRGEQEPELVKDTNIYSAVDLLAALENGQFRLFYQPQFSPDGRLSGLEALLRLEDPILGMVTPDAFIDVAERNEVIVPLGAWVLRQALADASRMRLQAMEDIRMAVNVSMRQIQRPNFPQEVASVLRELNMPASCLEIEITERVLATDEGQSARQLDLLHEQGIRIAIDDFGIGSSCLGSLYKYHVDTLKIDKSFVRAAKKEPRTLQIIESIIALGTAMQKRVVVEGIESQEEVELLLTLGSPDLQGYLFSHPQPFHIITDHLSAWRLGVPSGAKSKI